MANTSTYLQPTYLQFTYLLLTFVPTYINNVQQDMK
jgi:hypothetical protein